MIFISLLLYCTLTLANLAKFDNNQHSQVCAGVYSKKDWGGSIKPHIGLSLSQYQDHKYDSKHKDATYDDIKVSYIIFEYKDLINIGAYLGEGRYKFICDEYAVNDLKVCSQDQIGQFIVNANSTNSTILSSQLHQLGNANIDYPINQTGYYCISTFSPTSDDVKYRGTINFQNAFGQLNASEIPKLPAYGILTLCYAIALALFGFQFFKKRKENQILPLQRYLLAMLGFLTFDTLVIWSYYDYVNRVSNRENGFGIFYMIFMAVLNAVKITFSFFLLLCIALGYGVVKLKLNKRTMLYCKILAGFNFASSLTYLIFNYISGSSTALVNSDSIDDGDASDLLGLLPLIPISIVLSIYYVTILTSLRKTTQSLHQQRQIIKLQLYQNLFKIVFSAIILTFLGLTLSSFIYLSMSTTQMFEEHWKSAFFIFDFWPSVVFFMVFMIIAWLWRPTETSYMLAVSQQLSTGGGDEDDPNYDPENPNYQGPGGTEFELDDLSLMSHDDDDDDDDDDDENLNSGRNNSRRNVDRDSFEIDEGHQSSPKSSSSGKKSTTQSLSTPDSAHPPPGYEETNHRSSHDDGATLFDLGEDEEDDDDDEHAGEDDRLKKKD
ncbi:hypothetical protein KGF57_002000 [Candida theae]|uniref:Membrane protein PTM1 n=1 Tax=Candida theae TaxID=1198502 RepID=A0AAD5BFW0_9ASCO|nr:uncharacterized protein KGF57_002000 [Candida theae]KAI5960000.1 hypothetical protein KGF57_002000 [Candida theae]